LPPLDFHGATESAAEPRRERTAIPDNDKWDLTPLYPSDEAWKQEKIRLIGQIPSINAFKGTLGRSSGQLRTCLDTATGLTKELVRLNSYASMKSDQDTRESGYLAMVQEVSQIYSDFSAAASYIEPEILRLEHSTIDEFLQKDEALRVYRHYLHDLVRRKFHTGTEGEEKIIADAGLMADGPQNIYGIFSNADFPDPDVTLSDGTTVKLDKSAFSLHRTTSNREDRRKIFAAFFGRIRDFRRTFGTQLNAEIKKNMFYARARKYESCLASALDGNNIPKEVYNSLVDNVNKNLPTFHRYLGLRKRMLGIDELHYYDLYAPLVHGIDLRYSVEEAQQNILASLKPLGDEYRTVSTRSFRERWIDMFPNVGKRSGAYSNGSAYDVHPYMLMNYNGKYDDMSTLTHELGHTMHSYFSNRHQPYATASYSIFVAEVASTLNEALLNDHMLKIIKDDEVRLSLLGNYLEGIKGTVFRQTQFAEFELKVHEMAERGEALTGDTLDELYDSLTKKYYGHDRKICIVDDEIRSEWAYIPHFYYNFYVYQYATSFTASSAISEKILSGEADAVQSYLKLLSSGGSDYPINLLKNAGVDMTTPEPLELTMKKMNRVMDEMEQILG
jgi:oligoendopeptidase F